MINIFRWISRYLFVQNAICFKFCSNFFGLIIISIILEIYFKETFLFCATLACFTNGIWEATL